VSLSARWQEIRSGFAPAFWVANGTELFERLAYYGLSAVLAIYLHEQLRFTDEQTGLLQGVFGFVVWFLPIFGGALADRLGYRRILSLAYLILSVGYFLIGSIGAPWLAPVRAVLPLYWVVFFILMIPALGPGLVKPVVAGTTARASSEAMRSFGYSIYYTIVNIGGALGPLLASGVRSRLGVVSVFYMSALFSFAMFLATVLFFRELPVRAEHQVQTVAAAARNMLHVLRDLRVVVFLLIFSGFYVVFWQVYVGLPLFVREYVNAKSPIDALISIEGFSVIATTVLVAWATRRFRPVTTMATGVLITSLSWLLLTVSGSAPFIAATLVGVAIGEVTQAPRYYEYVSKLAPKGQEGTYLGYAFLPIAIGYLVGGPLGGWLVRHFGASGHPAAMWYVVTAIGVATAALLWGYDRVVRPGRETTGGGAQGSSQTAS
jgi:POT family proton-dependent oligopeptide transporter